MKIRYISAPKVKNLRKFFNVKTPISYINQFDQAVKNFEQSIQEEQKNNSNALKKRLTGYI